MRRATLFLLSLTVPTLSALAAFAAGEPSTGGDSSPSPTVTKCKQGEVWDDKNKKCVAPKKSELDDDSIYAAGRDLAYAERPQEAIAVLQLAANPRDPRILNYLGYAHRQLGEMNQAFDYYRAAVAAKADYTLVREYLGEAYLQVGDLDGAKTQLAAIRQFCGPAACLEYKDLAEGIAEYERQNL